MKIACRAVSPTTQVMEKILNLLRPRQSLKHGIQQLLFPAKLSDDHCIIPNMTTPAVESAGI
jgi:hypothetical protein